MFNSLSLLKVLDDCITNLNLEKCAKCSYRGKSDCRSKLIKDIINQVNQIKETNNLYIDEINELRTLCGIQRKREFYNKFVKEIYQKEFNDELIYPDFDEIYKRYFEQKEKIESLENNLSTLLQNKNYSINLNLLKEEILAHARIIQKPQYLSTEDVLYIIDAFSSNDKTTHYGHWEINEINGKKFITCSACKSVIDCDYHKLDENEFNCCPYCGVTMTNETI